MRIYAEVGIFRKSLSSQVPSKVEIDNPSPAWVMMKRLQSKCSKLLSTQVQIQIMQPEYISVLYRENQSLLKSQIETCLTFPKIKIVKDIIKQEAQPGYNWDILLTKLVVLLFLKEHCSCLFRVFFNLLSKILNLTLMNIFKGFEEFSMIQWLLKLEVSVCQMFLNMGKYANLLGSNFAMTLNIFTDTLAKNMSELQQPTQATTPFALKIWKEHFCWNNLSYCICRMLVYLPSILHI